MEGSGREKGGKAWGRTPRQRRWTVHHGKERAGMPCIEEWNDRETDMFRTLMRCAPLKHFYIAVSFFIVSGFLCRYGRFSKM